mgnify:CR=1 FL=1
MVQQSDMLLGSLCDRRLRVYSPIRVGVYAENGTFILAALGLDEFGFGENRSDALTDLQHTIAELYFVLEAKQDRLGQDLCNIWQKLKQMVRRDDPLSRELLKGDS